MRTSILPGAAMALVLVATPVFAQAQTTARAGAPQTAAQRLSIANAGPVRAGASVSDRNRVGGGNWGWIIGAIGLVAGVAYALIEGDSDSTPSSP